MIDNSFIPSQYLNPKKNYFVKIKCLVGKTYILENFFSKIGIVNSKQIDMKKLAERNICYTCNFKQANHVNNGAKFSSVITVFSIQ